MFTNKYYKASLKYTLLEANCANQERAILLVSVGQHYHENEKLLATLLRLNDLGLKECTIMVADTLQRHNYYDKIPEEMAFSHTLDEGDKWIARNAHYLKNFNFPYNIIRWETLRNHPRYQYHLKNLRNTIACSTEMKAAFNQTIEAFLCRQGLTLNHPKWLSTYERCQNYIIEECPIIMPLCAELGYDTIIYPKPMTAAMESTYHHLVTSTYPNKANWATLRFKKLAIKKAA